MTTKRKTQARGGGKGEAPGDRTPEQLMCVSVEEFERLISEIADADAGALYDNDATVGAFLLLLHSVAYADDNTRFLYLNSAARMLLTCTDAFQKATDNLLEAAACAVKKGGE